MKRIALVVLIAAAVAAISFKSRWVPYVTPWLPQLAADSRYLGYVEGETTLIASPVAGRIDAVAVERGQEVAAGTVVFRLDSAAADAEVVRTEAGLAEAKASLANLETGKRPVEQEVVVAQRREAEAALELALQELERARSLVRKNIGTRARFDQATSQVAQLKARIEQLKAQEAAGALGGREMEREAARQRVREAEAMLEAAKARQCDLAPQAPKAGAVEDVYFRPGEWVAAGQPVVSVLEPGRIMLRFFVPQSDVPLARPGASVRFGCDGCGAERTARIVRVSPRAEYTPPVIYSESARQKLVFLVEAVPDTIDPVLRPGVAVEVAPLRREGEP